MANLPLLRLCGAMLTKDGKYIKLSFADGEGESVIYRNALIEINSGRKYDASVNGNVGSVRLPLDTYKAKETAKPTATPTEAINDDCPF